MANTYFGVGHSQIQLIPGLFCKTSHHPPLLRRRRTNPHADKTRRTLRLYGRGRLLSEWRSLAAFGSVRLCRLSRRLLPGLWQKSQRIRPGMQLHHQRRQRMLLSLLRTMRTILHAVGDSLPKLPPWAGGGWGWGCLVLLQPRPLFTHQGRMKRNRSTNLHLLHLCLLRGPPQDRPSLL